MHQLRSVISYPPVALQQRAKGSSIKDVRTRVVGKMAKFCGFSGAKIVILSPIDFLFGLPINLNVNAGQNKFKVDILKMWPI